MILVSRKDLISDLGGGGEGGGEERERRGGGWAGIERIFQA